MLLQSRDISTQIKKRELFSLFYLITFYVLNLNILFSLFVFVSYSYFCSGIFEVLLLCIGIAVIIVSDLIKAIVQNASIIKSEKNYFRKVSVSKSVPCKMNMKFHLRNTVSI